jgi:hypothetical protein
VCAQIEHENGDPPVASLPAGGPDFVWDSAVKHVPDLCVGRSETNKHHLVFTWQNGGKNFGEFCVLDRDTKTGGKKWMKLFLEIWRFGNLGI